MQCQGGVNSIRNSNLELLRIFCMITIIADHFVGQSGIARYDGIFASFFYTIMMSLSKVSCSVFIIISSWFLVDSKFQVKRVLHIWLTVIMYTVPITIYTGMQYGVMDINAMYQAFMPIQETPLWFANYYIILVFFSPILNMIINKTGRKTLELVLYFFFVFMVLYATITAKSGFFSHQLWILIFLYCLTGYIKKYGMVLSFKKSVCMVILIEGGICVAKALAMYFAKYNLTTLAVIAEYAEFYRIRMQTIPNLMLAYSLFFLFYNINMKHSPMINKLATATLGVYCIHQVPIFYNVLWKEIFNVDYFINRGGKLQYVYTIAVILCVWIVGTIVELLRSKLSYIVIESRKLYLDFCARFDSIVCDNESSLRGNKTLFYIAIGIGIYYLLVKIIVI